MNTVRIHVIDLHPSRTPPALEAVLSDDERDRRDRFYFAPDRQAYTVCRGSLRHILGMALAQAPDTLRFTLGPYGKPHLADQEVHFNVSHSADIAVIAVSETTPIGVDIEQARRLDDLFALARRHFSPTEQEVLAGLPGSERVAAFFRCWARKEAFIKAIGLGLNFPLHGFDVSLAPGVPAQLLDIRDARHSEGWRLHHLEIAQGYAAALVTQGTATITVAPFSMP